jgi:hypothetical protein
MLNDREKTRYRQKAASLLYEIADIVDIVDFLSDFGHQGSRVGRLDSGTRRFAFCVWSYRFPRGWEMTLVAG